MTITTIRYGFHGADLFDGWDDEDQYDTSASAQKYADLIETKLQQEYSNAEIEILFDLDAGGVLPLPMQAAVNGFTSHEDVPFVEDIVSKIYHDFEWTVEK